MTELLLHRLYVTINVFVTSFGLPCWARDALLILDNLKLTYVWMPQAAHVNYIVRSVQSANCRQWFTWLFSQTKLSRFYSLLIGNNPPEQLKPAKHPLLYLADKFKISLSR